MELDNGNIYSQKIKEAKGSSPVGEINAESGDRYKAELEKLGALIKGAANVVISEEGPHSTIEDGVVHQFRESRWILPITIDNESCHLIYTESASAHGSSDDVSTVPSLDAPSSLRTMSYAVELDFGDDITGCIAYGYYGSDESFEILDEDDDSFSSEVFEQQLLDFQKLCEGVRSDLAC